MELSRLPIKEVRRFLILLLSILILPSLCQTANISSGSKADRIALLAFKAAVSDPHGFLSSWNGTQSVCQWRGVTCGQVHPDRVAALDLESMDLLGSLSPSIGNLTFLQKLHLPNNSLHGVIPLELGHLHRLDDLNLSSNSLDGAIPASLSDCRNLVSLDLTSNFLAESIPGELNSLSKLKVLNLATNNLTGAIPLLGNLSSLEQLDISINQLSGVVPPSLGNLSSLSFLDLSTNGLSGPLPLSSWNLSRLRFLGLGNNVLNGVIPPQISGLPNLAYLDLSHNVLTGGIPSSLANLPGLSYLILSTNNISGSIPDSLGDISSLSYLDLSMNNLKGIIPPSLTNLSYLSSLDLSKNNLHGSLPEDLGRLTSLGFFQVSENILSGTVPLSLFNISSLATISIVNNQLSGGLPPNIGLTLPNLVSLNLVGNQLGGPIPISLCNASMLSLLDLGNNTFSGVIPVNLGSLKYLDWLSLWGNRLEAKEPSDWDFISSLINCTLLKELNLADNDLRGELPSSIANLSLELTRLTVNQNKIVGSIPLGIERYVNLNMLGIQQNLFTGIIPESIGKLQKLEALVLFKNKLSGTIPSSLGNLSQLVELYLEENNLEGSIPRNLGNCQKLTTLDLSRNNLSGSIPKEVFGLSSLSSYFDLSYNLLDGTLPSEVGELNNLGVLNIAHNNLSGEIPSALGRCVLLEYLSLDHNEFVGVIPSSLEGLKGLRVLDFSYNNLSGDIPAFLANLHNLQSLNLSFNDLSGELPKGGAFGTAGAISILGNEKLCGGIPDLHLPPCPADSKNKTSSPDLAVILSVVFAVVFLILLLSVVFVCYSRRNAKRRPALVATSDDQIWHVSYADLLKATDDFSYSNLLGAGSYGTVYKGIMNDGEIVFAVKVLNLQHREAFKSFIAECQALRNIRHRNLVKLLTLCSTVDFRGNDFRALVFEYMPNGSLEKWLHPELEESFNLKKLSLLQRISIAVDVAAALDYLHNHCESSIIHCDIKPSNVLLDDNMTAHLGDFGISRFLPRITVNAPDSGSSSIAIKGSFGYVAPEYGMGGKISTYADVYSYGILLLELFTGKRPTDDMFTDGLTLQKLVEEKLGGGGSLVSGIIDPLLLSKERGAADIQDNDQRRIIQEQCMISVIKIGLSCAVEVPRKRMKIKDVATQMDEIKAIYLTTLR